jgi:hypothetical protein
MMQFDYTTPSEDRPIAFFKDVASHPGGNCAVQDKEIRF